MHALEVHAAIIEIVQPMSLHFLRNVQVLGVLLGANAKETSSAIRPAWMDIALSIQAVQLPLYHQRTGVFL
jgi:hypothetical protein